MKHWQRWLMAALVAIMLTAALTVLASGGQDSLAQSTTIYVDADATGANNGTSWEDAYTTLQPALDWADIGDQIWVAAGIYTPTHEFSPNDPRTATFHLLNEIALYGGFDPSAGDTGWEDRDWVNNVTILSGDIGVAGDPSDNSYHVFYHPSSRALDGTAILNGFTVTGGNANGGSYPHNRGGGMFNNESSPTVTNCTFTGNSAYLWGGGMFNESSSSPAVTNCTFSGNQAQAREALGGGMVNVSSSPVVTGCTFSGNSASSAAGGMHNVMGSSPVVINCIFSGNSASSGGGMLNGESSPVVTNCIFSDNSASSGGGMLNDESSPVVTNCTFSGNSAGTGGGMFNRFSSPTLTNCIFSGNSAYRGGSMYNALSSPTLTNCIIWGDSPDEILDFDSSPAITYSDIRGSYDGTGNIDADPLFMDPTNGDFHLARGSLCIDAGTNSPSGGLPDHDFEGDPRVLDGNGDGMAVVDMGIDEALGIPGVIYVDQDVAGDNSGSSWEDAYTTLQPALDAAATGNEIWVAAGIYTPTYKYSPGDPRSATFQLKNEVVLYGGFDPTVSDTGWEDRDWVENVTTLSGDIGIAGDPSDNSYHVFYHPPELAVDGTAVLDGFTVTGGNANGGSDRNVGGGMHNIGSSPRLTNCTFSGNSAGVGGGMYNEYSSPTVAGCTFSGNSAESVGGGMLNSYSSPAVTNCIFLGNSASSGGGMFNGSSSPLVTNCTFSGNSADHDGGGIHNWESSPEVADCTFSDNSAYYGGGIRNESYSAPTVVNCTFSGNSAVGGGGMATVNSNPTVVNCTFSGNSASSYGGGIYSVASSPRIVNCTFSGNSAGSGGGMYNYYSSRPFLTNCILWGDSPSELSSDEWRPIVSHSDIQGGYDGEGNIDADPLFVDPGSGDYHLGPGSPCIDAGTNDALNLPDYDFEGDPRVMDGNRDGTAVVDMGVDEVYGYALYLPLVFRGY